MINRLILGFRSDSAKLHNDLILDDFSQFEGLADILGYPLLLLCSRSITKSNRAIGDHHCSRA